MVRSLQRVHLPLERFLRPRNEVRDDGDCHQEDNSPELELARSVHGVNPLTSMGLPRSGVVSGLYVFA